MLLSVPPLNPPENREMAAEIMFETFNVPGISMPDQALLALIASRLKQGAPRNLNGIVIDAGHGTSSVFMMYTEVRISKQKSFPVH